MGKLVTVRVKRDLENGNLVAELEASFITTKDLDLHQAGRLAMVFEAIEEALDKGTDFDPELLVGMAQGALSGNNTEAAPSGRGRRGAAQAPAEAPAAPEPQAASSGRRRGAAASAAEEPSAGSTSQPAAGASSGRRRGASAAPEPEASPAPAAASSGRRRGTTATTAETKSPSEPEITDLDLTKAATAAARKIDGGQQTVMEILDQDFGVKLTSELQPDRRQLFLDVLAYELGDTDDEPVLPWKK